MPYKWYPIIIILHYTLKEYKALPNFQGVPSLDQGDDLVLITKKIVH